MIYTILTTDTDLSLQLLSRSQTEYQLMTKWLSDPVVLEWYEGRDKPQDLEKVKEYYQPRVQNPEPTTPCLIWFKDIPIGYLQFHRYSATDKEKIELTEEDPVFGIDLFLGESEYWNQGLGTRILKLTLKYLFENQQANLVVIDPLVRNIRAIRCYEKAGFQKVKLLKAFEEFEGKLEDVWLMQSALNTSIGLKRK